MKKVLKSLAFVAATMLTFTACSEKETDEVNNFRIQRGTNVSHWLSQSEERGDSFVSRLTKYSSGTNRATSCPKPGT